MQPPRLTYFIPPLQILRDLLDSLKHWQDLLSAIRFSTMLCNTEGVVKSLAKHGVSELASAGSDIKDITDGEREFIGEALTTLNEEEKNGYAFLLSQATLNMYTYLEAAIQSLVIGYFHSAEKPGEIKVLNAIQVPFVTFQSLSEEERMHLLYDHYEKAVGANGKQGVKRFERLLEPLGLSGPRSEVVDEGLRELALVRHLLLYKNGIVDKSFIDACPWYASQLGRRLAIPPETFDHYNESVMEYISILMKRIREKASVLREAVA